MIVKFRKIITEWLRIWSEICLWPYFENISRPPVQTCLDFINLRLKMFPNLDQNLLTHVLCWLVFLNPFEILHNSWICSCTNIPKFRAQFIQYGGRWHSPWRPWPCTMTSQYHCPRPNGWSNRNFVKLIKKLISEINHFSAFRNHQDFWFLIYVFRSSKSSKFL